MTKNKGIIRINDKVVKELPQDCLNIILKDIFPVNICKEEFNIRAYYCYSDLFDCIEEGDEIPEYDVIVQKLDDGSYKREEVKRITY